MLQTSFYWEGQSAAGNCYNMSCLELMPQFEPGIFDFVFADPPFNIGEDYDTHNDKMPSEEFAHFTASWIYEAARLLRAGGVCAFNVPDNMVHLVLNCVADHTNLSPLQWVIWHYRFGVNGKTRFTSSHTHCLIFKQPAADGSSAPHTWNLEAILVESDRATKYNDSRTLLSETPGMRVPLDVWSIENDGPGWGRIPGNARERIAGHPNQLPEKYLSRLLLAYTNAGDLVLDPFGGTGTTAAMAYALKRRFVTCDVSAAYCADIATRINWISSGITVT